MKASDLLPSLQADRKTALDFGLKPNVTGKFGFSTQSGCPSCNGPLKFQANNGSKGNCKTCGRSEILISELKHKDEWTATATPSTECPTSHQIGDLSDVLPMGDESPQSASVEPPRRIQTEPEPELPHGREPGCDDVFGSLDSTKFVLGADFCKQPPSSNSIIRGMLDYDSLAYCWGDSEAGKSFLMLDRDLHIANGMKWCGRKTKQGLVLYIVGEGKHGLIKRVKAWHDYYGLPVSNNILFRTIPTALCDPKAVDELVAEIKLIVAALNRRPTLIELDTVNRNFGPGDENSTKDMTAFVAGLDALRIATGAAISAVHHCGHGDKTRSRGSIVLHNSVDFEYRVSKEGDCFNDYVTTLEFIKVKDYEKPKPLSWKWKLQTLPWADEDDDGNIVSMNSVVFVPTEYVETVKKAALGDAQRQALDILKALYSGHRQNLVDAGHDPEGAKVTIREWSTAMRDMEPNSGNRTHIRDALKSRGLVAISDGYVKPL